MCPLTHSVGLSVVSSHHQGCAAGVCVRGVAVRAMPQQEGHTLHMVGEGRGVEGGPGGSTLSQYHRCAAS